MVKIDVFPAPGTLEPAADPLSELEFACAGIRNGKIFSSVSPVDVERVSGGHAIVRTSLGPDLTYAVPLLVVRQMPLVYQIIRLSRLPISA